MLDEGWKAFCVTWAFLALINSSHTREKRQLLGGLLSNLNLGALGPLNLGRGTGKPGRGSSGTVPLLATITGLLQNKNFQRYDAGINRTRTPEDLHSNLHSLTPAANRQSLQSITITRALKSYREQFEEENIPNHIQNTISKLFCHEEGVCKEHGVYRTFDGSCNNLEHPKWGRSETPLLRLLPPQYADDVEIPRLSVTGKDLPSPRKISATIALFKNRPDSDHNLCFMQFGQFLIHDTDLIPVSRKEDGSHINCCTPDGKPIPKDKLHSSCFPIAVEENDSFYSSFNVTCMNFVRSARAITEDCNFRHADQLNQITNYLDCSMVYGSSDKTAAELREFRRGLMKVFHNEKQELLPHMPQCKNENQRTCRFITGDIRANQQPWLQSFHLVFLREHNRIARALHKLNRHWSDETLFQESRRILIAQFQHIVYKEWLPIVLGRKYIEEHGLQPPNRGYCNSHDRTVNPSISNEFATFACRFGHTLVGEQIRLLDKQGHTLEHHLLREQFNNVSLLHQPDGFDQLLRGLYLQKCQKFDNFFTWEITRYTYKTTASDAGFDLVALNIQRGRDHGLPGYIHYREFCNLSPIRNFKQMKQIMPKNIVAKLAQLYDSVEDVDPFIGAIAEFPAKGALVGATMQCLIADQFQRLWRGDSFFYCEATSRNPFTHRQLAEIEKTTMSRILCSNSDAITNIQAKSFEQPSKTNPFASCSQIPQIDLSLWKEAA